MQPQISVIILNWNGKADTEECLLALKKVDYSVFNIILVDNGSQDDSVAYFRQKFPEIKVIANNKNLGFAEGNNIGFREAIKHGAEYVLLLNNDTVVDSQFLKELVKTMQSRNATVVCPKIYNYYEKNKIESAGFIIKPILAKTTPIGYGETDIGQYDQDSKISFASGCVMLIKTAAVQGDIFDPYYFAYCEDLEFCYRLQKSKEAIWYSSKSKVWHKVSKSSGGYKSPLSVYLFTKNRFRFVKRNLSAPKKLFFYSYLLFYIPAFIWINVFNKQNRAALDSFLKACGSIVNKNLIDPLFEFIPTYRKIGINARYIQRQITGIERYTLELINNLSRLDDENKYVLFFNKHEPVMPPIKKCNFVNYITRVPTKFRILRIFWEQFWLAYELKRNDVQIFHGPSFLAPLTKKSKYVVTIHDLSFFRYPESFTLENKLYFKFFLQRSIKNADVIIADSESTKKDIIHYFKVPDDRISVVYLGVDDTFVPLKDSVKIKQIKAKYNLPEKFILFTGVLSPRKNLERTLIAFCLLKRKKSIPHKFVIVGKKGWLYETIFEKIKLLNLENEVVFTDYVPEEDLPYFYNLADVFVLASLYEGFGLPILEAMACGCPVVTSSRSSMPEVAGDAALLVDPLKVEEISAAIEKIVTDTKLRKVLVEKGFEQAKKFSWKKTAEETLKIYDKISANT